MPDFSVNTTNMDTTIGTLQNQHGKMSDLNDSIRDVIVKNLTEQGIEGDQAQKIVETYMEKVAKPAEEFFEKNENYIDQTQRTKESFEENNSKANGYLDNM